VWLAEMAVETNPHRSETQQSWSGYSLDGENTLVASELGIERREFKSAASLWGSE